MHLPNWPNCIRRICLAVFLISCPLVVTDHAQTPTPTPSQRWEVILTTNGQSTGTPVPYQYFLYERLGTDAGWYSGITDKNGRAYFAFVPCFGGSGFGSSNRVGVIKNDGTLQMAWPFNWQTTCGDFDLLLAVNPATVSNARYNAGELPWPFPCVGQPVNVTTGNMWIKHEDYAVEDLNVTRTYNSAVQESGVFGWGWSSTLDTRLRTIFVNSNSQQNISLVQLELGSGRLVNFVRTGTSGTYVAATPDFYGQLAEVGSEYRITWKDGRISNFSSTGLRTWEKDRNGNQTNFTYNANNQLIGITDPFGRSITIAPNANNTIAQISDGLGVVATYGYDPTGVLLKTVTYSDGSSYSFDYDSTTAPGKTLLTTVKDALNNVIENHAYDSTGRALTSEKHGGIEKYEFDYSGWTATEPYTLVKHKKNAADPYLETKYYFGHRGRNVVVKTEGLCGCGSGGSETVTYEYDARANLTKKTDALGLITTYTWDANGNPLTETDIHGTQRFTYNSFGQLLTYRDRVDSQSQNPIVYTQVNTYDATGNLKTTTDTLGKITTIEYPTSNNRGLPDSIKDARDNVTKFKWYTTGSQNGLLEEIEDPYEKKTRFTYDTRARVKTVTNALNHITTFNYFDDAQRKVEKVYPNSDKITWKYDIRRTLESVTDERGKVTAYEFDPQYRVKKVTDPLGHAREFSYDLMSNLATYKDPLGNITDYRYDDFNRLKEIEHPAAESGATRLKERFEYDKVGRILKYFDTANRLTEYGYNDTTRTNTVTNAELETTTTKYNLRFQTFEVKDAINQVYAFSYDPLGRLLSQTRGGTTMTFEYDAVGNRKKRIDYQGRVSHYTFDKLNRLEKIVYGDPTVTPNTQATYGYDDISRLTSATNEAGTVSFGYDNRNRLKNTTDVFGNLLEYEYERTSTVNQRRLKLGGALYATYNFDDAERLSNILNAADSAMISFGYDNEDKVTSRTYPNSVTTSYQYFANDLLKRITDANSSTTLFDRQYFYNTARQISQVVEPNRSRSFSYDNSDRLTSVTDATHGNENYSYDDAGNRLTSHLASNYGYQTGQVNRLISATTPTQTVTYGYDANGNTTSKSEGSHLWRYTWDNENRMVEASTRKQKMRYKFDALGRQVQRFTSGGRESTKFIYDGLDVLVDDDAGTLTKYLNGVGIDNKLRSEKGTSINYFLADHLGSTNGLVGPSGAVTASTSYDSFGNSTNTNFPSRYQYTGREYDSFSSFNYYRARSYDAKLGRFMSEDPIGFGGGMNWYSYVGNNSLKYRDPHGLFPSLGFWPFNVHQRITDRALIGRATPYQREVLSRENERYDAATQDSIYAPMHAMRRPGQTAQDARAEANDFVRRRICEARGYADRGLNTYAMRALAAAIHTLQDSASPSHTGFQEAWPNTIPFTIWNGNHYLNEQFDPGSDSVADMNTQRAWDYFKGQGPMPHDFFSNGFDSQHYPEISYGF